MSNKPFSFTLFGQPATKKNSASLFRVKIKGKNQYRPIITPSDFFLKAIRQNVESSCLN